MILETIQYLLTPCSWTLRRMGYVKSQIGLRLRYGRCHLAWKPHLDRTKKVIIEAISKCEQRRKAVIFGSGFLHDLPINELCREFREVILVDVVHPLRTYLLKFRNRNIRLLRFDVTATADEFLRVAKQPSLPLPKSRPTEFENDNEVDLVVSLNLASQLPVMPSVYLRKLGNRPDEEIDAYCQHLIAEHLEYLKRLPGTVVLITDVEKMQVDHRGDVVENYDIFFELEIPWVHEEWIWELAPLREIHRDFAYVRRVVAVSNVKTARHR